MASDRADHMGQDPPRFPGGIGQMIVEAQAQKLGPGVRWIFTDKTDFSTYEFLRERGRDLPAGFRTKLALASLEHVLEESPIRGFIDDPGRYEPLPPPDHKPPPQGSLPPEVPIILGATLILQRLEAPEVYREHRENLRAACESLRRFDGEPFVTEEGSDPALDGGKALDHDLAMLEELARKTVAIVEELGFHFRWDTRLVEAPSGPKGGRPRTLLRDLIRCLAMYHRVSSRKEIELIASELAPFFSPEVLDTSPGSLLYKTLGNVIDSKGNR